MSFEHLMLTPLSKTVDVTRISGWLNALPHAFYDIPKGCWHLSATPRMMQLRRQERLENLDRLTYGVIVYVDLLGVYIHALADRNDLARGLEFVQWLFSCDRWIATVDGIERGLVEDARKLFPDDLPDPASLMDNLTVLPVPSGKLVVWQTGLNSSLRTFAIHSSAQWSYETEERSLHGLLSPDAIARWNTAIEAIDTDDPELPDRPDPTEAVSMTIETPEDSDWAYFDTINPPIAYQKLVEWVARWTALLDRWVPGTHIEEMTEVESDSLTENEQNQQ